MRHKLLIVLITSIFTIPSFSQKASQELVENKDQEHYFKINKNINIFNSVLRELDLLYVDTVDIDKTVRSGIDYMLSSLDPYNEYYNEEDMKDFTFMTTGEYAGVGALIGHKDGRIIFMDPYEDKPAAKAGIKAGDVILAIDGVDMTTCEKKEGEAYAQTLSSFVSSSLKGQPNSTIEITVERYGEKKPLKIKVLREKIVIAPITYFGMLNESTGYISLSTFNDKTAKEIRNAYDNLKKEGMQELVLDLRLNGGGIMEEAVQVVNMFVPKGKVVVSTKGKIKQTERVYKTTVEPLNTEIPLIILIDEGSASASEIVAGALQDMDRAVLIGKRSFGKGLVQLARDTPFGGGIKITTSKYYTPSGRCVQALDYSHRKVDGTAIRVPDSLTNVFHTELGREVRDGGGIIPDITMEDEKVPTITYYLSNQYIIMDWVNQWVYEHKKIEDPKTFTISEEDYNSFKEFVKSKKFEYDRMSEKSMKQLKEVMEFEGYMKTAGDEFKALEEKLVPDLDRDLEVSKDKIKQMINAEISKRFFYQKGEFISKMQHDSTIKKALEVLNDQEKYKEILSAPTVDAVEVAEKTK